MIEEELIEYLLKKSPNIDRIIELFSNKEEKLMPNSTVCLKYEDLRKKKLQFIVICDGTGNFHWLDIAHVRNLISDIIKSALDGKISVDDASKLVDLLAKYQSKLDF